MLFRIILITLIIGFNPIIATPEKQHPTLPRKSHNYLMLSMTKGGTHLLYKLLKMVSSNKNYNVHYYRQLGKDRLRFPPHHQMTSDVFLRAIEQKSNPCLIAHLNFYDLFQQFSMKHPDFKKFVMVRDLRDICVSTVYHKWQQLNKFLGENASFNKRLHYVINPTHGFLPNSVFNIAKEAEKALACMMDPSYIVCRFEILCGKEGGGSTEAQAQQVKKIAKAINIDLTDEELLYVVNNLWGDTNTFRKGKIGSWKDHFKPSHIKAFKKHLGIYLTKMGYLWN